MWCSLCCFKRDQLEKSLKEFSYCPKACKYCHCTSCNRLKCMDNPATPCACEDCIDRVEASDPLASGDNGKGGDCKKDSYKSCHFFPGCNECSRKPPEPCLCETCHCKKCKKLECKACECADCNGKYCHHTSTCNCKCRPKSDSNSPTPSVEGTIYSTPPLRVECLPTLEPIMEIVSRADSNEDNETEVGFKDAECQTEFRCDYSKLWFVYFELMGLFNFIVRVVYGSNQGVLREIPRVTYIDKLGRQVVYVDDIPVLEKANFFQFILIIKALLWLAFSLSVGADALFVKSDLNCDASRDCYILDNNFNEVPITNCTEIVDNQKQSAVCYELVFDYTMALSVMGGLLSFTRFELTIITAINTALLKKVLLKKKARIWLILSVSLIIIIALLILLAIVGYGVSEAAKGLSPLRHTGRAFQVTGYFTSVIMSLLIPWYLLVKPNFCKDNCNCT